MVSDTMAILPTGFGKSLMHGVYVFIGLKIALPISQYLALFPPPGRAGTKLKTAQSPPLYLKHQISRLL